MIETGRYVRYSENQRLGGLHLSLLKKFGVDINSFASSDSALPGLDASNFEAYREPKFDSWIREEGKQIVVQGRLRMSDNLDEAKVFFIDVKDKPAVRVEVNFRDFHDFNLAYHCGTPVVITGNAEQQGQRWVVKKVTELKSMFGKKPGVQKG
jgi:hypothetical protein